MGETMSENGGGRGIAGLIGELRQIARRGRHVWGLVPRRRKLSLGVAVLVMGLASAAATAIPLGLGRLMDADQSRDAPGRPPPRTGVVGGLAAGADRSGVPGARDPQRPPPLPGRAPCTRIDRDLGVRVVGHLLRVDLGAVAHEQVGALHGRITRSVDGFVRFLRITFLDFLPAILTGSFALVAALTQEARDRPGDGRRRAALAGPDVLAAPDPARRAPRPHAVPRADGRHRGRAARRARLRPRRQHRRARDRPGGARWPRPAAPPRSATSSRCRSSAAARR